MKPLDETRLLALLYQLSREGRTLSSRQSLAQSPVKACGSTQLAYPAQEASVQTNASGVRLLSHTFSLTGVLGALPYAYTGIVAQRNRDRETALQDFLDLFNHRAITLLYEAWLAYQWIDTAATPASERRKSHTALLAYAGIDPFLDHPADQDSLHDHLINHAGLLSRRTRTASGLTTLLKHQFGLNARIEQFVGRWFDIAPDCLTRLNGQSQLGMNTSLGTQTLHSQAFFRIHLNIADANQYQQLEPGSEQLRLKQQLIRLYVGEELQFQIVTHLHAALIPQGTLGTRSLHGTRLGWSAILGKPAANDTYQTTISRDYSRS